MKSIVLLSGGLDSSAALASEVNTWGNKEVDALSINYNQRHVRELTFARLIAQHYGVRHSQINLPSWGVLLESSALTNSHMEVPDGHYEDETMKQTVVPNRNAVLLALATSVAVDRGARFVVYGAHSGDHAIYPDCRPEFYEAFADAMILGNIGFIDQGFEFRAPFLKRSKAEIVVIGKGLQVPFELTWSCYKGGELHCGTCGTCNERIEAFRDAQVPDPTVYQTMVTI